MNDNCNKPGYSLDACRSVKGRHHWTLTGNPATSEQRPQRRRMQRPSSSTVLSQSNWYSLRPAARSATAVGGIQYSVDRIEPPVPTPNNPLTYKHFFNRQFGESETFHLLQIHDLPRSSSGRAALRIRDFPDPTLYRVHLPPHIARPNSAVKSPERCPAGNSTTVGPKGTRAKKLETIRLHCSRTCGAQFG